MMPRFEITRMPAGLSDLRTLFASASIIAILVAFSPMATAQLSDEAQMDLLAIQLQDEIQAEKWSAAYELIQDMKALGQPLQMSVLYLEAKAAYEQKEFALAKSSVEQFINSAGRQDPLYGEALALYSTVTDAEEAEAARIAAEQAKADALRNCIQESSCRRRNAIYYNIRPMVRWISSNALTYENRRNGYVIYEWDVNRRNDCVIDVTFRFKPSFSRHRTSSHTHNFCDHPMSIDSSVSNPAGYEVSRGGSTSYVGLRVRRAADQDAVREASDAARCIADSSRCDARVTDKWSPLR